MSSLLLIELDKCEANERDVFHFTATIVWSLNIGAKHNDSGTVRTIVV